MTAAKKFEVWLLEGDKPLAHIEKGATRIILTHKTLSKEAETKYVVGSLQRKL